MPWPEMSPGSCRGASENALCPFDGIIRVMITDARLLTTLTLDGTDMLVSADTGTVRVTDPRTGRPVSEAAIGGITAIVACPTGWRDPVIAVGADSGLYWVEARTGTVRHEEGGIAAMSAWAGTLLAAAGHAPGTLLRWDAGTGARLEPLGSHQEPITAVTVLHGPVVCTGDRTGTIQRWNPRTGARTAPALTVGDEAVLALAPAPLPDGRLLIAAATADLHRWDAVTGEPVGVPVVVDSTAVTTLTATVVNGRTELITAGHDEVVRRWDAETGLPVGEAVPGRSATVLRRHGVLTLAVGTLDGRLDLRSLGQPHPDRRI
ncbi:putative WD repeat-containing protein [Actinoplanes sp. SE50]|nr:putative WD repeat-containing protein [Actinoplanes sp. SE50/110]ATO84933.1 putative WD repeat-containing protein [Actinoplanes sp. SE50]SLM02342.1 hypothetical protein ACSP50_5581 [Actinoplanes sp. SE50/110]